ncbi:MAG TPA: 16S rRNA (guanine(966)-N(2))-methyltransferase RsmD, partial [Rhodospirillaceae bacterium]|nr:16S rRNA (guanine(966)-N(2))-methyltransferase RsmD [Rhodospirillaceae bacterium]
MRVVAGKYKGRTLLAPAGRDVRPTGDRVREAMFNLLAHGDYGNGGRPVLEGASVLDAFAGSGALGFEAISRGASRCVFMEITASTIDTLRKNA